MAEYIEREAVYEDFEKSNSENPKWTPSRVKTLLVRQKAADVVPVRHCRWIKRGCKWQCTYCKVLMSIDGSPKENLLNYCPNCGAKMDGWDEFDENRKSDRDT